ncbi:MAG: hypothetical protein WC875_02770 [Candidatus Absconditabacterales bacterium]
MELIETILEKLHKSSNSQEFMNALAKESGFYISFDAATPDKIGSCFKERKITEDEIINVFGERVVFIQILGKNAAKTEEYFWVDKKNVRG